MFDFQAVISAQNYWILAQSRIGSLNEAFREKSQIDYSNTLIFCTVIVCVVLISLLINYWYNQKQKKACGHDPWLLFYELCTAHSLTWFQRRALKRLSLARELVHPGLIFLDPNIWPDNAEADSLVGSGIRKRLCELRRNLFRSAKEE